jgi:hypothetical protein
LYEDQKYGFKAVILRKTRSMSKSNLTDEVEALQGNMAFLTEFLDIPHYKIVGKRAEDEKTAEMSAADDVTVQPPTSVQISAERPADPLQPQPLTPVVVVPKVVMTKTVVQESPKKNYGGKYVIWTPNKPLPDERVLIKKIIEAVHILAADLVLETNTELAAADWSSTPLVFAFGIQNLPGELHQIYNWQGTRMLKTCSLAELSTDLNQKKALWGTLKITFKL